MKLKHLFAMALLAIGGSAWGQDVYKDVTSTYLSNADFSDEYTSLTKSGNVTYNNRSVQQPKNWEISIVSPNKNDASLLTSDDPTYDANIKSYVTLPAKNDATGVRKYTVRFINGSNSQKIAIYQQPELPVGSYRLKGKFYQKNQPWIRCGLYYDNYDDTNKRTEITTSDQANTFAEISRTFDVTSQKQVKVGIYYRHTNTDNASIASAYDFKLECNLTQTLKNIIDAANSTKIAGDASKYLAALEAAITTAEDKKDSQDASELEQAITDLSSAIEAYTERASIINSLINVRKEIARAEAYTPVKPDVTTAYAAAIDAAKNAIDEDQDVDYSSSILVMQNFKVEDYSWVNETYTQQYTGYNSSSMNIGMQDASDNKYGSGSGNYRNLWMSYSYDCGVNGNVTLPAGDYVLKCIGRASTDNLLYIQVKIGENEPTKVYYDGKGSTGLGVDENGAAGFDTENHSFANNGKGYGWEWRFITFHLDQESEVELGAKASLNNTWVSVYNPVLYMTQATKDAIDLAAAKDEFQTVIDAAPSGTANVGTGAFQIPDATATTYTDARTAAQTAHDAQDATLASIAEAKSTFEAAINTFRAAELNAPAAGKKFTFTLGGTNSWNGKAITYIAGGRNDQGNYGVSYEQEPNAIYAQAFTMTQVEGNKYKMSQTDADGQERYLCTAQGGYNTGSDYQIRTTTTADDALVVEVVPTDVEDVYNLKNTAANANIGSKDNGVYTNDGNGTYVVDFAIAEAQQAQATMSISSAAKYGTFVAPFSVEMPRGVEAYTLTVSEGAVVKSEALNTVPANTPVLVYAEAGLEATNFEGWGLATKDEYTVDNLVGNLAAPKVIPSSDDNSINYLLQKQGGVVAFYKIGEENNTLKVGTNRCYLNVPATQEARDFFLLDGEETGISSVGDEAATDKFIYDLSGRRVQKAQKGLYIINGKKVIY